MNALVVFSALVAVASAGSYAHHTPLTYAAGYGLAHGYAAAPLAYSTLNAAVPAPLPTNGLSPGLDKLVRKTAISAAGRPVTRITPHVRRVEPEITYKQVDVPVPVANPVPVRKPVAVPVPYRVTPVVETTEVVQPVVQPIVRQAVTAVRTAHVAAAPVAYAAHGYAAAPAAYAAHGYAAAPAAYAAHGYAAAPATYAAHGYAAAPVAYAAHGYAAAPVAYAKEW